MVNDKYMYYRKKKLSKKMLGSSTQLLTSFKIGVQSHVAEKSRKNASGDLTKAAEVTPVSLPPKKKRKVQIKSSIIGSLQDINKFSSNLPCEQSAAKNESRQKVAKVSSTVQSAAKNERRQKVAKLSSRVHSAAKNGSKKKLAKVSSTVQSMLLCSFGYMVASFLHISILDLRIIYIYFSLCL